MSVLELKNISKSYDGGTTFAVVNFNIALEPGIYGLLGPNGAGKSTLMNIITENISDYKGILTWDGDDVLDFDSDYRSIIGYMPQQQGLYENFTGDEFIWYMAALKGLKKKEVRPQVEELFKTVNLMKVRHKKIGSYSGGMKQRLLIAQALLGNPEILIMDEPTAGLDPEERIRIRNLFSKIAQDRIVLIATHVISDIEFISDHILLMKNGRLIKDGTPSELIDSVKDFVWECTVTKEELEELNSKGVHVSDISYTGDGILARIISTEKPDIFSAKSGRATMEDVYIYYEEVGK